MFDSAFMGIARNKNAGSCVTVFKNLESKANVTMESIQEHEGLKSFHGQVNRKVIVLGYILHVKPYATNILEASKESPYDQVP